MRINEAGHVKALGKYLAVKTLAIVSTCHEAYKSTTDLCLGGKLPSWNQSPPSQGAVVGWDPEGVWKGRLTGRARGTVGAHHLLRLGDDGTTGAARARTGLAIGRGAQGRVSVVPVRAPLALRAGCVVSAVTNTCAGSRREDMGKDASG